MKSFPYLAPEGQIPVEKRMTICDALLFDGLEAPSKRRKKTPAVEKESSTPIEFEKENLVSDEEIKGDATQPYEDSDEEE